MAAEQLTAGPDALTAACAMVEHRLRADVAFMNGNGLLHFDAHFRNILTDGRRLYLADLGLATSTEFDLSTQERDFAARNRTHDTGHTLMELVNWLVTNAANRGASGPAERNEYIRRCAHGHPPTDVPPLVAALISQYAPIATVMNDFYWNLFGVNRTTPYPEHEIAQAMALTPGIPPTATVPGGSTAPG